MNPARKVSIVLLCAVSGALPLWVSGEEVSTMLTIASSAFGAGQSIPTIYTCEGQDRSPPLSWSGVPAGTKSLALIVDDPDAPDPQAPKMTWVHWLLYDIPPATHALAESASSAALPPGAVEGRNDFKRVRYGGPCPPIGRHRYFHKLYALDTVLPADKPLDKPALEAAMRGHVLAHAQLMGTYQKGDANH